jgi:hypothetical protein
MYEKLEGPIGSTRGDVRVAYLMSLLANINRNPKKKKKAYTADDFMLKFEAGDEEQTIEQQQGVFSKLAQVFGAGGPPK